MACCKPCCGCENCTEGQSGKCCCGGAAGTCCTIDQVCCADECCDNVCCTGTCCKPGEVCCDGGPYSNTSECCPTDRVCCEGVCCPQGQSCVDGECTPCLEGETPCGALCCTQEQTCCNNQCCDTVCCDGVCCPPGFICVNGQCVNSDPCAECYVCNFVVPTPFAISDTASRCGESRDWILTQNVSLSGPWITFQDVPLADDFDATAYCKFFFVFDDAQAPCCDVNPTTFLCGTYKYRYRFFGLRDVGGECVAEDITDSAIDLSKAGPAPPVAGGTAVGNERWLGDEVCSCLAAFDPPFPFPCTPQICLPLPPYLPDPILVCDP